MEQDVNTATAAPTGYHEGDKWSGLDRWECDFCPFDSLDEGIMRQHVRDHSAPEISIDEMAVGSQVSIGGKSYKVSLDGNGIAVLVPEVADAPTAPAGEDGNGGTSTQEGGE